MAYRQGSALDILPSVLSWALLSAHLKLSVVFTDPFCGHHSQVSEFTQKDVSNVRTNAPRHPCH